jgi:tetratricopeptide (TPR) repeat protein
MAVLATGLATGLSAGCSGVSSPDGSRPEKAETWYRRAQHEFREADFDEAHDSLQKAQAIVPEDPDVRLLSAEVALASLDYAEVLRLLKGIPGSQASRLRGRALWYKGDLEVAADELDALLNDPEVTDEWAKATSKLARRGAGRVPFDLKGGLLSAVEMVHVSPVAPYFVVPLEIDGESALAMIATGSGEVVVDSATRPEPSWVSLRFDHLEIHDVPALPQDLSGISKELGAPIKALLGVNLLRRLNATFDFTGRQFVVRSFAPPPPPAATRVDLHYARGGGMIVRAQLGGEKGPRAALMVDTSRPFFLALDADGWKKAGIAVADLKLVAGDPEQKLREGTLPLMRLGAFDIPRVSTLYGVPITDLEKATAVDLDGLVGAALLYPYRCTFADGGRVLWIEDDTSLQKMLAPPGAGPPPAQPLDVPTAPAGDAPKPGRGPVSDPPLPLPKR